MEAPRSLVEISLVASRVFIGVSLMVWSEKDTMPKAFADGGEGGGERRHPSLHVRASQNHALHRAAVKGG